MKITKKTYDRIISNEQFSRRLAESIIDYFLKLDEESEQRFVDSLISNQVSISYQEAWYLKRDWMELRPDFNTIETTDYTRKKFLFEFIHLKSSFKDLDFRYYFHKDSDNCLTLTIRDTSADEISAYFIRFNIQIINEIENENK